MVQDTLRGDQEPAEVDSEKFPDCGDGFYEDYIEGMGMLPPDMLVMNKAQTTVHKLKPDITALFMKLIPRRCFDMLLCHSDILIKSQLSVEQLALVTGFEDFLDTLDLVGIGQTRQMSSEVYLYHFNFVSLFT